MAWCELSAAEAVLPTHQFANLKRPHSQCTQCKEARTFITHQASHALAAPTKQPPPTVPLPWMYLPSAFIPEGKRAWLCCSLPSVVRTISLQASASARLGRCFVCEPQGGPPGSAGMAVGMQRWAQRRITAGARPPPTIQHQVAVARSCQAKLHHQIGGVSDELLIDCIWVGQQQTGGRPRSTQAGSRAGVHAAAGHAGSAHRWPLTVGPEAVPCRAPGSAQVSGGGEMQSDQAARPGRCPWCLQVL